MGLLILMRLHTFVLKNILLPWFLALHQLAYQIIGPLKLKVLILSDCLLYERIFYVPDFSFNILSKSAITRDFSVNVQFHTNTSIIREKYTLKKISSAKLLHGNVHPRFSNHSYYRFIGMCSC